MICKYTITQMDDSSKCYQRRIKMLRELKAGFHGCVFGRE